MDPIGKQANDSGSKRPPAPPRRPQTHASSITLPAALRDWIGLYAGRPVLGVQS